MIQNLIDIIKKKAQLMNEYWFLATMMVVFHLIACVIDNMRFGYSTTCNLVSTNVWLAASIIILAMRKK